MDIDDVELVDSQIFGDGGFVGLRRCRVRNVRDDGSRSQVYTVDMVERGCGPDAVAVVPYCRDPVRVLLRRGLRPVLRLARRGVPLRDGTTAPITLVEVVAGVIESQDEGSDGLRRRAAAELLEEAGIAIDPQQVAMLGPPMYLSPGVMPEQLFFCAVETPLDHRGPIIGDGSMLEEGGAVVVLELEEALRRCDSGDIADLKTECAVRRLQSMLG